MWLRHKYVCMSAFVIAEHSLVYSHITMAGRTWFRKEMHVGIFDRLYQSEDHPGIIDFALYAVLLD